MAEKESCLTATHFRSLAVARVTPLGDKCCLLELADGSQHMAHQFSGRRQLRVETSLQRCGGGRLCWPTRRSARPSNRRAKVSHAVPTSPRPPTTIDGCDSPFNSAAPVASTSSTKAGEWGPP